MQLPTVGVPVASVRWSVHLPARLVTSRLVGDVEPQRFVKNAFWQPTPDTDALLAPDQAYNEELDRRAPAGLAEEQTESAEEPEVPQTVQVPVHARGHLAAPAAEAPRQQPQAGADAAGAVSVRIEVPRTGSARTHARYWVGAGEPVSVRFRYVGAGWLTALEVLGALLLALLLAAAGWPRPILLVATRGRRVAAVAVALVLAVALVWGAGAWPAVLGAVAGLAAVGVTRGWWGRGLRRLRESAGATAAALADSVDRDRRALAERFAERREKSLVWALLGPAGSLAWLGVRLVAVAVLVASLVALAARLLEI